MNNRTLELFLAVRHEAFRELYKRYTDGELFPYHTIASSLGDVNDVYDIVYDRCRDVYRDIYNEKSETFRV